MQYDAIIFSLSPRALKTKMYSWLTTRLNVSLTQCHFSIHLHSFTLKLHARCSSEHLSYTHTNSPLHLSASYVNTELLAKSTASWDPGWKCPQLTQFRAQTSDSHPTTVTPPQKKKNTAICSKSPYYRVTIDSFQEKRALPTYQP